MSEMKKIINTYYRVQLGQLIQKKGAKRINNIPLVYPVVSKQNWADRDEIVTSHISIRSRLHRYRVFHCKLLKTGLCRYNLHFSFKLSKLITATTMPGKPAVFVIFSWHSLLNIARYRVHDVKNQNNFWTAHRGSIFEGLMVIYLIVC